MRFEKPENENYCATVVKLKALVPLENSDNIVGTPIFGFQAIVSKNHQVGDIGIVFPVETQLSEEFCRENNLFRHNDLNKDKEQKGYLEDNRRVKAVKFRGNVSNALFMPLESLSYLGIKIADLKEGDEFDKIEGHEICKKYVVRLAGSRQNHQPKPKTFKRVDTKYIPEHFDNDNFFKFRDQLKPEQEIVVTQKLHGTSIRIAHTIVLRKLNLFEHVLKFLGVHIQETEMDYVFGSRRVIKDVNNPYQADFYDVDIWTQEGKKLEGVLPENFIVYGELIGWTPTNAPIQVDYTYHLPQGVCELFVYRIAFVNKEGIVVDLAWEHLKEFCSSHGLKYVPEIYRGTLKDFDVSKYLDKKLNDEFRNALPVGEKLVDEGVCIRVDKMTPYILKAKSPIFLEHESKMLDKGEIDLETEGSENAEN